MGKTKYVDINGTLIKGIATWRKKNPGQMYFDSEFERKVFLRLKDAGFEVILKPDPITLVPKFQTHDLGYCKELKTKLRSAILKAKDKKQKTRARKLFNQNHQKSIEQVKVDPMTWAIDYLLPDFKTYVEAKGHPNEAFPNKLKLARYLLSLSGYKIIVVRTLKDCEDLVQTLKQGKHE